MFLAQVQRLVPLFKWRDCDASHTSRIKMQRGEGDRYLTYSVMIHQLSGRSMIIAGGLRGCRPRVHRRPLGCNLHRVSYRLWPRVAHTLPIRGRAASSLTDRMIRTLRTVTSNATRDPPPFTPRSWITMCPPPILFTPPQTDRDCHWSVSLGSVRVDPRDPPIVSPRSVAPATQKTARTS